MKNPLPNGAVNFTIRERTVCCVAARPVFFGGAARAQPPPMPRLSTPRNPLDAETEGASVHPVDIQVIERAMRLLDALAAQQNPVTLKELSATTGLHASTAHRILNDLVVGRYVERVDNGLYQLGMRLLELGSLVKGRLNVREA